MLVCDVSAIDRLIDMYGENLSVMYKDKHFKLYDLRDEFVDNNIECSLDLFTPSNSGIKDIEGSLIISIELKQNFDRDDLNNL